MEDKLQLAPRYHNHVETQQLSLSALGYHYLPPALGLFNYPGGRLIRTMHLPGHAIGPEVGYLSLLVSA